MEPQEFEALERNVRAELAPLMGSSPAAARHLQLKVLQAAQGGAAASQRHLEGKMAQAQARSDAEALSAAHIR